MDSIYRGKNPDDLYLGEDGMLKGKCEVCQEEMNFCDMICYAKKEEPLLFGHRACLLAYGRGEKSKRKKEMNHD